MAKYATPGWWKPQCCLAQ